jgi:Zn-dependent peptidase ImmA (M78 family)
VPPGERLHEVAKKLNVARIEAADVDGDGFLAEEGDGRLAVYYEANRMPERRRFTVAHELAHLILNKYHKHLSITGSRSPLALRNGPEKETPSEVKRFTTQTKAGLAPHSYALERAVDRIAAELLMPEGLVIPVLRDICHFERENSPTGVIDKRKIVCAVGKVLGVSDWTFVLRLREIKEILAVQLEFQWSKESLFRAYNLGIRNSPGLEILSHPYPSRKTLEGKDGWELPVRVKVRWGERTIRCHAWQRPPSGAGLQVTWVVGWTWNCFPKPNWDDAEA